MKYYDQKKCKGYSYIALNEKYKQLYDDDDTHHNTFDDDEVCSDL